MLFVPNEMLDDILLIKQFVLIWKSDFPVWGFFFLRRGRLHSPKCSFVFQLLGKQEASKMLVGVE